MATVEVSEVEISSLSKPASEGWTASIDAPSPGSETDLHVLEISARVDGPAHAVALEVLHEDEVIRSDAAGGASLRSLVSVLALPREFELHLRALLADGAPLSIGSIRGRHEAVRSGYQPRLQPIILTSLGRMGTTWLMKVFAAHPQVAVHRRYPYELSTAKYWAHALEVLSRAANGPKPEADADVPDTESLWSVGPNPFLSRDSVSDPVLGPWLGRSYVEQLAAFTLRTIDDWYTAVARTTGDGQPLYFAEKHMPVQTPDLMRNIYAAAKEIFLVRDPRDMAWSVIKFDRARGFTGFGRESAVGEEEYIRTELRRRTRKLLAAWQARRDSSALVRYEDLVLSPDETLAEVLDYLELESSPEVVRGLLERAAERTPEFDAHRTSASLEQSIGLWCEAEGSLRAAFEDAFSELVDEFGYRAG
jgi:Sulfotransferase family